MMFLKNLSLLHFKNYKEKQLHFSKRIVCIYGQNGSGKTSILDAIHFLCFTKSYFLYLDSMCITEGEQGMRIQGDIQIDKPNRLICVVRENGKKEFYLNDEPYRKFSKHIGQFPCVFIAPDDTSIITEGSEIRRKFLDTMISQTNAWYLEQLIQYTKCLQQRNALLKQWMNSNEKDYSLLSIYSKKLDELGLSIYTARKEYCAEFTERVKAIYAFLSNEVEEIGLSYHSQLDSDTLINLLDMNVDKDILTQRTNYGIHKDDLLFYLKKNPLKQVASQGQRKSFLFSLKLAQFELVKKMSGANPFLLLDDIFEKLDESRSAKLIEYLLKETCQIFITDTHEIRLRKAFELQLSDVEFLGLNI
jgi:DNA replication and repair protein RecF